MSNNNNSLQVYIVMEFKGQALWGWLEEKNRSLTDKEEKIIETTVGQLNFFRWAIKTNIIEYINDNYTDWCSHCYFER